MRLQLGACALPKVFENAQGGSLLQIQVCNSIIAHDADGAGSEVRRADDQLERG